MADTELKLQGSTRTAQTKGKLNASRTQGMVPAVVYGEGKPGASLFVPEKEFRKVISTRLGENAVINLEIQGSKPRAVMVKEIQREPIRRKILHVDFLEIKMTEKLEFRVPIFAEGEAAGTKVGGILEHILREIRVRCLPGKVPPEFKIVVTPLEINSAVMVKDLPVPADVEILEDMQATILHVVPPARVEEPTAAVAEPTAAEPEVISKGKKPGEEEEAAAEGAAAKPGAAPAAKAPAAEKGKPAAAAPKKEDKK